MSKPCVECIKVSDDPIPESPYQGRLRDADGLVLHGVYLRKYSQVEHKLFISNGNMMRLYSYPRIVRCFESPMVNDHNLHLCGGWIFPEVAHTECITRVIEGKKPAGFLVLLEEQEYRHWLEVAERSGLPCRGWVEPLGESIAYKVGIARNGTFGENFDMAALEKDYRAYYYAAGFVSYFDNVLADFFTELSDHQLAECLESDYANPKDDLELIATGLFLGYPIESTVSINLNRTGKSSIRLSII